VLVANEELDVVPEGALTAEDRLLDEERRALLGLLLDHLEPRRRAVVVAYELEGVPMAEVAAAEKIPVNTAWNRLRLGRQDLRAAVERLRRKRGGS
jgi:RNA polymerase sigma-70 factor (ECF subfamily)